MSHSWVERAACLGSDTNAWYPEVGDTGHTAKRICTWCPVREECLQDALRRKEQHGVWGGLSPRERRRLSAAADPTERAAG